MHAWPSTEPVYDVWTVEIRVEGTQPDRRTFLYSSSSIDRAEMSLPFEIRSHSPRQEHVLREDGLGEGREGGGVGGV